MEKSIYSQRYKVFMDLLIELRLGRGLSQTALADALQMTQSMVSKCERRERRLDVIEAHAWCGALGAPFLDVMKTLEKRLEGSAPRKTVPRRERS